MTRPPQKGLILFDPSRYLRISVRRCLQKTFLVFLNRLEKTNSVKAIGERIAMQLDPNLSLGSRVFWEKSPSPMVTYLLSIVTTNTDCRFSHSYFGMNVLTILICRMVTAIFTINHPAKIRRFHTRLRGIHAQSWYPKRTSMGK